MASCGHKLHRHFAVCPRTVADPDVVEARERARHEWEEDRRAFLARLEEYEPNPEGDPHLNGAFG